VVRLLSRIPSEPLHPKRTFIIDDKEIIEKVRSGETGLYAELVRRHQARVIGLCRALLNHPTDAEDAAQESFLKAFKALPEFKDQSAFSTWIYRIAYNTCREFQRRASVRRSESLEALVDRQGDALGTPFHEPQRPDLENADLVRRLLAGLSEDHRIVLLLRETQGMDYLQIAETLGITLDAVKARLRRAREALIERSRHF